MHMVAGAEDGCPDVKVVLVAKKIEQLEIIRERCQAGQRGGPGVVDKVESFDRQKVLVEIGLDDAHKLRTITHTVEAVPAGVDYDGFHSLGERYALLLIGKQDPLFGSAVLGMYSQKDRHVPSARIIGPVLKVAEEAL